MNPHKNKKLKKGKLLSVYPLGVIDTPCTFCDIVSKIHGHVCCITSCNKEDNVMKECVIWDKNGFPDVYVKSKKIGWSQMKKGIKMLEKDKRNRFKYNLIKKG